VGLFNVREAFGDGVVLFDSSGEYALINEWGVTLDLIKKQEEMIKSKKR
jgi:hypothetical protein